VSRVDVFEAIRGRRSVGKVTQQAVPRDLIDRLLAAAVEAPNHHETEPWRFFVLTGTAREEFGDVLAGALEQRFRGEDPARLEGLMLAERAKPLRAPVLIVVAARHDQAEKGGEKVVPLEDTLATAAAVQNMLLAAHALGLAAQWRTGDGAFDPRVKAHFGLDAKDDIVAIVYVGYRDPDRDIPRTRTRTFADKTQWRGWE
jgi:nitroreductase